MISVEQAHTVLNEHLGNSPRAHHSIFVAFMMKQLAETLSGDARLWEVVGLCHDLDFIVTANDRSRHGLVAADWLKDDLPPPALLAIQAHDHRTGVRAETELADALKLADAIAVAELTVGREALVSALAKADKAGLRTILNDRPYLPDIILNISRKYELSLAALADACSSAPPQ